MSRFIQQFAASFVSLLRESDIITREGMGTRGRMAVEFRDAIKAVKAKDVDAFAREFSAAVLAGIRVECKGAEAKRLALVARVRVSEAKRVYVAFRKGSAAARKVYAGKLTVVAFLKALAGSKKGKAKPTMKATAFAKLVKNALTRVSRKERAAALAALALVVRKARVSR